MKKKFVLFICLLFLISGYIYAEEGLQMAADFHLVSGDEKETTLSDYVGDVIICFYESKKTANINNELKKRLNNADFLKKENIPLSLLAVADCSSAKRPFINAWKKALMRRTQEVGYTVYGDWDGAMRDDYDFIKNESNFIIIDKTGKIQYRASGKISDNEIDKIIDLLTILL